MTENWRCVTPDFGVGDAFATAADDGTADGFVTLTIPGFAAVVLVRSKGRKPRLWVLACQLGGSRHSS